MVLDHKSSQIGQQWVDFLYGKPLVNLFIYQILIQLTFFTFKTNSSRGSLEIVDGDKNKGRIALNSQYSLPFSIID